jgi:hypothetical protein
MLPTRLYYTGKFASKGHVPETDAADAELAQEGPGASTKRAAIV